MKALLSRVERLESRAGGSGPPPAPCAARARPLGARHRRRPRGRPLARARPRRHGRRAASEPAASPAAAPRGPLRRAPEAGRTAVAITAQVEGQPPVAAATTLPGAPETGQAAATEMAEQAAAAVSAELATEADPAPAVAAVAVVEPDAPAPEPSFTAGVELSLEAFAELWPAVLQSLEAEAPMLAALLESARPADLGGGDLTLAWPESSGFFKRKAEDPANQELIGHAIRAVTGSSLRLAYELRSDGELAARARAPAALRGGARQPLRGRVRRRGAAARGGAHLMPQPPNLNKMLEQAQAMLAQQQEAQEKLKEERVEATAGGGMVRIVMTGDLRVETLTIDPDAVDPEDVEMLQDMVIAAVNEALRSAEELQQKSMGAAGGGGFDPMSALDALGMGGGGLGGLGGGLPGGPGAPGGGGNRAARRRKPPR